MDDGIRLCRLKIFEKLISCAARLLDRLEYLLTVQLKSKKQKVHWKLVFEEGMAQNDRGDRSCVIKVPTTTD